MRSKPFTAVEIDYGRFASMLDLHPARCKDFITGKSQIQNISTIRCALVHTCMKKDVPVRTIAEELRRNKLAKSYYRRKHAELKNTPEYRKALEIAQNAVVVEEL